MDIQTREQYRAALSDWCHGGQVRPDPDAATLARRYFFLFFARYTIPMHWTTSPLEPPYRLLIESIDELRPGINVALDAVCNGILNGRQILLPRKSGEVACVG